MTDRTADPAGFTDEPEWMTSVSAGSASPSALEPVLAPSDLLDGPPTTELPLAVPRAEPELDLATAAVEAAASSASISGIASSAEIEDAEDEPRSVDPAIGREPGAPHARRALWISLAAASLAVLGGGASLLTGQDGRDQAAVPAVGPSVTAGPTLPQAPAPSQGAATTVAPRPAVAQAPVEAPAQSPVEPEALHVPSVADLGPVGDGPGASESGPSGSGEAGASDSDPSGAPVVPAPAPVDPEPTPVEPAPSAPGPADLTAPTETPTPADPGAQAAAP